MPENKTAIDALPLYAWARIDGVGLLDSESVDVIVVPRDKYVELANNVIGRYSLPDDVAAALALTAHTADRFVLDNWVHPSRGCGCLIGEYLVAQQEIQDHNARQRLASQVLDCRTIKERLGGSHGPAVAANLKAIGIEMDDGVNWLLEETTGLVHAGATVFIRDV